MRCVVTLKDGSAMERAMGALAKYRYAAGGEPVAPEGHPREWKKWLLEINSAEVEAIRCHVDDGDIVGIKPVNEPSMERYIHNANIVHYRHLLAESERDPARDQDRHTMLLTLLAEEIAEDKKPCS